MHRAASLLMIVATVWAGSAWAWPTDPATQDVAWTSPVNVTVTANSLEKTGGCDTCDDAGAISTQQITSGDGYVEFSIPLTTRTAFVGLSRGNTDTSRGDIDFALKFVPGGVVEVRENNLYQAATGFAANDVFRVAVVGGRVEYSRNGVVFSTSAKPPLYPLLADTSLQDLNVRINNAIIAGATVTHSVVWESLVNVATNSLEKTGGCDTCDDAGAISTQQITSGDGYVEFSIPLTTKTAFVGLSQGNSDTGRGDIDFALKFVPGGVVEVRENNLYQAATSFAANDVFRVAVVGGQVEYSRNGVVFYTSAKAPTYPLLVDTSLQDLNVRINNAIVSGAAVPTQSVVWASTVNVTVTTNSLEKIGGCHTCDDAGAISTQQIASGDGYVEFSIPLTTKTAFVGLSQGNTDTSRGDIDFALKFVPGGVVEVRENNIWQAQTTFADDDVFRVAVVGGGVEYSRNGVVFHTSVKPPLYPLLVDTSLQDLNVRIDNAVISGGTTDTTPPAVSITSPPNGATVSGTVTISASASDDVGVAGVQFFANGAPVGAEDATAPYSVAWDTTTVADGSRTVQAVARDAAGNTATAVITVIVSNAPPPDTTPPTVTITSPTDGATVSGTIPLTASASDDVGVAGVQFFANGAPVGAEDTTAPYSVAWDTTTVADGSHTLQAVARDAAGNTTTSAPVTVTVANGAPAPDTTPPTVAIILPTSGATVVGLVTVTASASDNVGVAGVQFLVDGVALGAEDTTAPFAVAWDTTTVADGSHTLTARARDGAGNVATSGPVTVTVANGTATTTRFEETAATLAPAAEWVGLTSADIGVTLSGDRAAFSRTAGATATFTFTGTGVSWLGVRCERCGIANVRLDGTIVATVDTFAPLPRSAGVMFTASGLAAGSHTLVLEVTGTRNPSSDSESIVVDAFDVTSDGAPAPDTTPPTVTITAPAAGATVSGTVTLTASASDNVGVVGVQFFANGAPVGVEDTMAPYSVAWDTTMTTDGSRALTAVARDAAGNVATSAAVTVTVANAVPAPTPTRSEESAATLAPAAAWFGVTSASTAVALSGDNAAVAGEAGATATFAFTGTAVSWIGFPCEVCGIARVFLDGSLVATLDTFTATRPAASSAMFTSAPLAAGSHTLVLEVTGTANAASGGTFIVVDAFDVTP